MALQTQDLTMVGLGIQDDRPSNFIQHQLVQGVHLRWSFMPAIGVPAFGYYLFRRLHREREQDSLWQYIKGFKAGSLNANLISTPGAKIISDKKLRLTEDFHPSGLVEVDLYNRGYLSIVFNEAASLVRLNIGFREQALIKVVPMAWNNVEIAQKLVEGKRGDVVEVRLEFDAIMSVRIEPGPAALLEVFYVPVTRDLKKGWEKVPGFPYPMGLPLTHPGYPCTGSKGEDLDGARKIALGRIKYGNPDRFFPPYVVSYSHGSVSVEKGSRIVGGTGTAWDKRLAGKMLRIEGDATAYAILSVLNSRELWLSRPYSGITNSNTRYIIYEDTFSNLHDNLACLVEGGFDAGRMAGRSFTVIDSKGEVIVSPGSREVTGIGTHWDGSLKGLEFVVAQEKYTYTVSEVISPDKLILSRNYVGQVNAGMPRSYNIFIRLEPVESKDTTPRMYDIKPLDMVLLGALNPALAQMLGLYWVDQKAEPGVAYDYIILADRKGIFNGNPNAALAYLSERNYWDLEGFIVFNKKVEQAAPLEPPAGLRAFSLPGGYIPLPDGELLDARNNAGLVWELGRTGTGLLPGKAVMYHLWRKDYFENKPEDAEVVMNAPENLVTGENSPILVGRSPVPYDTTQRPATWPPFELNTIDRALKDGWYRYQVSGVDIFGRHSKNSASAAWHAWENSKGEVTVNPLAIQLLDKTPPPPPAGIEAYALDPKDQTILVDKAYQSWRASHAGITGIRVRWLWTPAHQQQANDIKEFRVYYRPGRMNALTGQTLATDITAAECKVHTNIPNTRPADAYKGAVLQIGNDYFEVLASDAASPLLLTVKTNVFYNKGTLIVKNKSRIVTGKDTGWEKNLTGALLKVTVNGKEEYYTVFLVNPSTQQISLDRGFEGPDGEITYEIAGRKQPKSNMPCTVSIPSGHPAFTDYTAAENWGKRIFAVGYDEYVEEMVRPIQDPYGKELTGEKVTAAGNVVTLGSKDPGRLLDLSGLNIKKGSIFQAKLFLKNDTARASGIYTIVAVDNYVKTLTLDGTPNIPEDTGETLSWGIGLLVRKYEVFIHAPDGPEDQFNPSLKEPVVYANIGVSSVDDQKHTPDNPKWTGGQWGNRYGNEGPIAQPSPIVRMLREPPKAPEPLADKENIYASKADFSGHSFYTYRWKPAEHLKVHIFRALDDAVFQSDLLWREKNPEITISATEHQKYFPEELRGEGPEIKATRELVAEQLNRLKTFSPNPEGRQKALAYYRQGLSNYALYVLASLPWNDRAFTQITIQPLDSCKLDPGAPCDYNLQAYVDTLDGRSTGRYFYKYAYIDGVQNISERSLSSYPVSLRDELRPNTPVVKEVLGGENQVLLAWQPNLEPGMDRYLVFRTTNPDKAKDIRYMGEPAAVVTHPKANYEDKDLAGPISYYYRIVAVRKGQIGPKPSDRVDLISPASEVMTARVFDFKPPAPPAWDRAEWVLIDNNDGEHVWGSVSPPGLDFTPAVVLEWSSEAAYVRSCVQRKVKGTEMWRSISPWLEANGGNGKFIDLSASHDTEYVYRVRCEDKAGKVNVSFNEKVLPNP